MPSQISVPSSRRYITAATLLDAIQGLTSGAGGTSAPVDLQPILNAIHAIAPVDLQPVLTAIEQLSNKVTTIDRDNDAVIQQMETKIMDLVTLVGQVKTAFEAQAAQHQQLITTAENAAATAATATAAAESLRQSNALLSANDQADAATIANLQADVATKSQALTTAQAAAAQAQADRDALQAQMDAARAELEALLAQAQPQQPPAQPTN